MRFSILPAPALVLPLIAGCHSSHSSTRADAGESPRASVDQLDHGRRVFADNCARCHGKAGQGTEKAPPLVGAGALPQDPRADQKVRDVPFRTALDVGRFAMENMPPDADDRKKLDEADYWAVVAFALHANDVQLKAPLDRSNAASVVLHR